MATDAVSGTTGSSSGGTLLGASRSQELDRNAFLKLLMTQMRYQDPMKPIENTEFIAQMAQFSSLEQMQQIGTQMGGVAESLQAGNALGYVGRNVTATNPYDDSTVTGKVNSVLIKDGTYQLVIDDVIVDPSWVTSVTS